MAGKAEDEQTQQEQQQQQQGTTVSTDASVSSSHGPIILECLCDERTELFRGRGGGEWPYCSPVNSDGQGCIFKRKAFISMLSLLSIHFKCSVTVNPKSRAIIFTVYPS